MRLYFPIDLNGNLIMIEKLVLGDIWTGDLPIFNPDALTSAPSRQAICLETHFHFFIECFGYYLHRRVFFQNLKKLNINLTTSNDILNLNYIDPWHREESRSANPDE